jgi:Protein of unknown function (DUF3667)
MLSTENGPTEMILCRSCNRRVDGSYCSHCGEKVMNPSEKSLGTFMTTFFHEITSLDGKFLKTLLLMLRRPGEVSYAYMNGKRVPFYKPVSMFFVANLLYFLFPAVNSLNPSLYVQMNMLPHSEIATSMVQHYMADSGLDLKTFSIQYDQQSTNMAKLFLILIVILCSIPLTLINYNRKMYYGDHLLVSLETTSLVIMINFVLLIWLLRLLVVAGQWMGLEWGQLLSDQYATSISFFVLFFIYLKVEQRAYLQRGWRALAKSAFLVIAFYFVLQTYRASLFFITIWTL